MGLISTKTHAVGDYAGGAVMIAAASLAIVRDRRAAALLRVAGASALVGAAITDNELGLWRKIPMPVHLALDAVGGALMAGSALALRAAGVGVGSWAPHLTIGIGQLAGAAITDRTPTRRSSDRIPAPPQREPDDDLVAQQEAAAAAEAASIGGTFAPDTDDPALAPVREAGGGEQEGFEQAEADLIENATHGDGHGNPLRDAPSPELQTDEVTAVYGEGDEEAKLD